MNAMRRVLLALACAGWVGCGGGGGGPTPLVVNSVLDSTSPPAGSVTLRSALEAAAPDQPIHFDATLDGATITLTSVADEHTRLKGEVMGIRDEPSGPLSYLVGYFDRDYGRSALVARKNVVIDASALPSGITIAWGGGDTPGARVLAVEGHLTLVNVAIRGGRSRAQALVPQGTYPQPWTLARGGAVAVWGVARLVDCRLHDNRVQGDFDASRDRGAFGGAVYADLVEIERCEISGNDVLGGGAAGGGVFVVGGAGHAGTLSTVSKSAVTGNRIRGLFAYGGGLFTDGGGIGNSKTLRVINSTVARNLVAPPPGLPASLLRAQGYWRGGGLYMSNGRLELMASTVAENETQGLARTDSRGRRNLAGGIAATVGDAHAAEQMTIGHSVIGGNVVQEVGGARYAHDVFTGSLVHFRSAGHNRIGVLDFSQLLVPVGSWDWQSLSRRHYPQVGDRTIAGLDEVLDLAGGVQRSATALSLGVDAGNAAVLHYQPRGDALDQIPAPAYTLPETWGQYRVAAGGRDDFLAIVLARLESRYAMPGFAASFTAAFEAYLAAVDADAATTGTQPYLSPTGQPILTLADTLFFGPAQTWPREQANQPYVEFWRRLDTELAARAPAGLGPEGLADSAWQRLFSPGALTENPAITIDIDTQPRLTVQRPAFDQRGTPRSSSGAADIGAVERP
ncbi:MAG: hypothetical protein C0505_07090 [Leptothrix sp. (in: Bacteria)]|nr:hypothetical protein [Leptothrix sp. (in: b-proteobacteria)]